jgi:hypothetical protein
MNRQLLVAQKELDDSDATNAQKDHYSKLIDSIQSEKKGPKILVCQPCAAGDIIVSSLGAELFKIKYPGCTVDYLTETIEVSSILRSNPFINNVDVGRKTNKLDLIKSNYDLLYKLYWWNPPMVKSFLEDMDLPTDYTRVRVYPDEQYYAKVNQFWGSTNGTKILLQNFIDHKWGGDRDELKKKLSAYGEVRDVGPDLGYSYIEIAALFNLSDLVVCVEGSTSHLAAAVGCQTVTLSSIYPPENVMVEFYQNEYLPESKRHITVRPERWCGDSKACVTREIGLVKAENPGAGNLPGFPNKMPPIVYKKCGMFTKNCITNISVDTIIESVDLAFQRRRR